MMRRCYFVGLLAIWVGASGCAGTARRPDGSSIFAARTAIEAPAPLQRQVAVPPERTELVAQTATSPVGLSKYFPSLRRNQTESPKIASSSRFTWFGLRSKGTTQQIYTTDARASLNRVGPEPTALPVSLQVPTDNAVTPTSAEAVTSGSPRSATETPKSVGSDTLAGAPSRALDFGGIPSKPGEDEVNPLPPAAEPAAPPTASVNRMPELPAIDPRERPRLGDPAPNLASTAPNPNQEPALAQTSDDHAVKAITGPADPTSMTASPEATVPASYSTHHHSAKAQKTVLASPQGLPSPPPPKPTPQAKPSPQGLATSQSCEETTCKYHKWKKPCFCRLVRKILKQGEYANPPVTMAH